MLEINGDYLEGGGQIIRTALALSILAQKSFKINNIRKGRSQPGLKEQHLQTVRAAARLCNGKVEGDNLHSTQLSFTPKKITNTNLEVNIGTAGSTALVLQSLLIAGTQYNLNIHIKGGGTWNTNASSIPYFQKVLIPILKKMNYNVEIETISNGFYPRGGAELKIATKRTNLSSLKLTKRGKLISMKCFSYASNDLQKRNVAERQSEAAKKILKDYNLSIFNKYIPSFCSGSGILLAARFENTLLGYDVVGEEKKTAEQVGHEAAVGLQKQLDSNAAVDEFMSDQLLPYLALAERNSEIKIKELTKHAETNIWLIKQFLNVDFSIKNKTIYVSRKE